MSVILHDLTDFSTLNWYGWRGAGHKAAGFTQQELADEIGMSRRMIAYYEVESEHPPTTLLPSIARALRVTTDALLGLAPITRAAKEVVPQI